MVGLLCVYRIKDKNGETVIDLVSPEDTEIRTLLRKSQAQASIAQSDVANGAPTFVPSFDSALLSLAG